MQFPDVAITNRLNCSRAIVPFSIDAQNLYMEYPRNGSTLVVLDGLTFQIPARSTVTIFGPNACGKTTLLRILARLEVRHGGAVSLSGSTTTAIPRLAMVPQNPMDHLLPWRRVEENLRFYLRAMGYPGQEADSRLACLLDVFGLASHRDAFPYELSAGLRQRLALACALSYEPDVLLLDEPFSALDYRASVEIALAVRSSWEADRRTTLCVCHNPDQCLLIGDRVLILSKAPARIVADLSVPVQTRRDAEFLERRDVQVARDEVLRAFRVGIA